MLSDESIGHHPPAPPSPNGRCTALTRAGVPCKGTPLPGLSVCISHSEAHREALRSAGRKGGRVAGRGRPRSTSRELSQVRGELRDAINAVRDGTLERGRGAVIFQGFSVLLKAVEVERRAFEAEELAERIGALEARDAQDRTGRRR
jgi:hypothetical protein